MLGSAYGMSRPSVICLRRCCTIGRDELFGNIFAPPNSSWIRTVCIKILGKNLKGI